MTSTKILDESLLSTTIVGGEMACVEVHHLAEGDLMFDFSVCHNGFQKEALDHLQTYLLSHYEYAHGHYQDLNHFRDSPHTIN